jgi:hypothetical protein
LDILVKHISVDGAKSILLADIFYFNCKGHGFLRKLEMKRVASGKWRKERFFSELFERFLPKLE